MKGKLNFYNLRCSCKPFQSCSRSYWGGRRKSWIELIGIFFWVYKYFWGNLL